MAYDSNKKKITSEVSGYSVFNSAESTNTADMFQDCRLWHGVPQMTEKMMSMFEAAYKGHQFFFVTKLPAFMTTEAYAPKTLDVSGGSTLSTPLMYRHAMNIKKIIETCCTEFNGPSGITANASTIDESNGRKIDFISSVEKQQNDISLKLHEFAGLPLRNGLEAWINGVIDYRSQYGSYAGNAAVKWCLANHTMSLLVVQTDPSFQYIQDCAYYTNMWPTEIPFDQFQYTSGDTGVVEDMSITFKCNEFRNAAVVNAAKSYMDNRILSFVAAQYDGSNFDPMTDDSKDASTNATLYNKSY